MCALQLVGANHVKGRFSVECGRYVHFETSETLHQIPSCTHKHGSNLHTSAICKAFKVSI